MSYRPNTRITLEQARMLRTLGYQEPSDLFWEDEELSLINELIHGKVEQGLIANLMLPENCCTANYIHDVVEYFYTEHGLDLHYDLIPRSLIYVKDLKDLNKRLIWSGPYQNNPYPYLIDRALDYLIIIKNFSRIK